MPVCSGEPCIKTQTAIFKVISHLYYQATKLCKADSNVFFSTTLRVRTILSVVEEVDDPSFIVLSYMSGNWNSSCLT